MDIEKKKYKVLILENKCIILTSIKDYDITNINDYLNLIDLSPLAFTVGSYSGYEIKLSNGAAKKKSKSPYHKSILGIHILDKELFEFIFSINKDILDDVNLYLDKLSLSEHTLHEIKSICTSDHSIKKNYITTIEIDDIDLAKLPLYNLFSTNIEEFKHFNF